jgi:hypothetical protein
MSAVATAECAQRALLIGAGGEPTLDEVLVGVWEGLTAHQTVACPVCGGEMEAGGGADRPPLALEGSRGAIQQLPLGTDRLPIVGSCDACGATVA